MTLRADTKPWWLGGKGGPGTPPTPCPLLYKREARRGQLRLFFLSLGPSLALKCQMGRLSVPGLGAKVTSSAGWGRRDRPALLTQATTPILSPHWVWVPGWGGHSRWHPCLGGAPPSSLGKHRWAGVSGVSDQEIKLKEHTGLHSTVSHALTEDKGSWL